MAMNVGNADRIIRVLIGIALIVVAALGHGPIRWLGLVGIVLIVTAMIRFCPAYWLMRVRTSDTPR